MLRLSTFLLISFEHRTEITDTQYDFEYDFFNELCGLEPEKPYINNLFKGVRDLTDEIKGTLLSKTNGYKLIKTFITRWLNTAISDIGIDDYYNKFKSIIENDEEISEKTKKGLLKPYYDEDYPSFISKIFQYAIRKENVSVKLTPEATEMAFLYESNFKCPLCGSSLLVKKSKNVAYKYAIVTIFPKELAQNLRNDFLVINGREPTDYDHSSNHISCCLSCANRYESMPTTNDFITLINKKNEYINKANMDDSLKKASLDDAINTVLLNLKNLKTTDEIMDFRLKPLKLKQKIKNNEILRLSIKTDVENYYNYLRTRLSELDGNGIKFRLIASQFQAAYLSLVQKTNDQEEIYNRIITWVLDQLKLTDKYRTATKIIVSFFVQNCEVFDEITE